MINLYEKTEKVTLVNPFRPPHNKLPYTALFYRTMTLNVPKHVLWLFMGEKDKRWEGDLSYNTVFYNQSYVTWQFQYAIEV